MTESEEIIQNMLTTTSLTDLLDLLRESERRDDNETYLQVQRELKRREKRIRA